MTIRLSVTHGESSQDRKIVPKDLIRLGEIVFNRKIKCILFEVLGGEGIACA